MWGLWWTKQHWGMFSPSTSVSLANHHSTNSSTIITTRGWHNTPIGDRSAEWTQLDSTPHYTNLKKNYTNMYRLDNISVVTSKLISLHFFFVMEHKV
jgi:hypothetical protein